VAVAIFDAHYSRDPRSVGKGHITPPGSSLVLRLPSDDPAGMAIWAANVQKPEWVKHAWKMSWQNTIFRNVSHHRASELLVGAVAASRWLLEARGYTVPRDGFITFVDPAGVPPTMVRGVPTWGRVYTLAGWTQVGTTPTGKLAFQLAPARFPPAVAPLPCGWSYAAGVHGVCAQPGTRRRVA
jgi:hypothetical protein